MPKIVRMTLTLGLLMVFLVLLAHADTVPIEAAHDEGLQIGMTIDQHNWQVAEHVLPPEILRPLQAGEFAITVQETTDFPPRQAYVAATEMDATRVTLDGRTRITNYHGGCPFPVLEATDPRGGEKAAWNFRYRDMPKAMELRMTMQSVNNVGAITMQNQGRMQARYGLHRVGEEHDDPQWQERGVYMKRKMIHRDGMR